MEWITAYSGSVHGNETARDILTKTFPCNGSRICFLSDIIRLDLCMIFCQLRLDVAIVAIVIPTMVVLFL